MRFYVRWRNKLDIWNFRIVEKSPSVEMMQQLQSSLDEFYFFKLRNRTTSNKFNFIGFFLLINTVILFVHSELIPFAVIPRNNTDEVGHEGRNRAFQNGCVSTDDVLIVDFGLVKLLDHWKYKFTNRQRSR